MSGQVFNVAVPVVELVTAEDEVDAVRVLRDRLTAAGFEVYEGPLPDGSHAFVSEPV